MYFDIIEARYIGDYKIELSFEDDSSGVADLSSYPDEKNIFRLFFDMDYFKNFRIEYGTLVWGSGELDIAPEALYTIATGKPVSYSTTRIEAV
jgi:hypothetical protein